MAVILKLNPYRKIAGRPLAGGGSLWSTIMLWQARARSRAHLAELDAAQLDDIGVSAEEAHRESAKPFWHA
ncbi:MAG: DUF1127 domain-containing protein [Pseudomonadota bacterium]